MRTLKYICTLFMAVSLLGCAMAQNTKEQKKQAKAQEIKQLIDSKNFVFIAQYANPLAGGHRYLNYDYDLRLNKDSLVSYLPYFGRVNFDPPIYPTQDGIMFTSTNFGYAVKENRNGSWDVLFTPQDVKYDRQLRLTVQQSGYATLTVNIVNRDPISFDGYVDKAKPKGKEK
jgi:hypothetical protein